jgi:HAD superfamily 5'-nucleotidase-like hydrolase
MAIFINRLLNLKKIKVIGFDMDHTIVRYKTKNFEHFTFDTLKTRLVNSLDYPKEILSLEFDFNRFIHGLVVDKLRGNILKLNRFGKVKMAYHGTALLDFKTMRKVYGSVSINLKDSNYKDLYTSFSISNGVLFTQLVDLKDSGIALPQYEDIVKDIGQTLDILHQDGTLKNEVQKNVNKYIIKDKKIVETLEKLKAYGKKLIVITNSDFAYTRFLLNETITPFLKDDDNWQNLFDYVITNAQKPRYFFERAPYLSIDAETGLMSNIFGSLPPGIYQGGSALILEKALNIDGDEILYFGDHIYGDVVSIKKTMNWRTALILDSLESELDGIKKSKEQQLNIEKMMANKEMLEKMILDLYAKRIEANEHFDASLREKYMDEIHSIDKKLSDEIAQYQQCFNPYWGEINRSGQEVSRFAEQVEKYACIYMSRISDLLEYSPRTYFRPLKRPLAHEIE